MNNQLQIFHVIHAEQLEEAWFDWVKLQGGAGRIDVQRADVFQTEDRVVMTVVYKMVPYA